MLIKEYRVLSEKDIERLTSIIKDSLSPLDVAINIRNDYSIAYCWMRSGEEENRWEEYWYTIDVTVDEKELTLYETFESNATIFRSGWLLAWKIFHELELDWRGEVADTLWGQRYELAKKYADYA